MRLVQVDTKCLARGSSDYCFKNWMKTGNSALAQPGGRAQLPAGIKAYQRAQEQMAALMHKRREAGAAATDAKLASAMSRMHARHDRDKQQKG